MEDKNIQNKTNEDKFKILENESSRNDSTETRKSNIDSRQAEIIESFTEASITVIKPLEFTTDSWV